MTNDESLRRHVLALLDGRGAHIDFDAVIDAWPAEQRTLRPAASPHSAWDLLEHLRIAQKDILDFSIGDGYVERSFPDDYWPEAGSVPNESDWSESVSRFRADREAMKALVADPSIDLHAELPHGTGQTLLREALVVADHNAYHVGQLALLRRMLDAASS